MEDDPKSETMVLRFEAENSTKVVEFEEIEGGAMTISVTEDGYRKVWVGFSPEEVLQIQDCLAEIVTRSRG